MLAQGPPGLLLGRGGEEQPGTSASPCLGLPSGRRLAPPHGLAICAPQTARSPCLAHRPREAAWERTEGDTTRVSGEGDPAPVGGAGRVALEGPGCPPLEKRKEVQVSHVVLLLFMAML